MANNTAFTTNQLLQKFITLVEKTKVYDDQVTEWNNKTTADKTWTNIKLFWL